MLNGTIAQVLIPAIYTPLIDNCSEEIKLGRRTEWRELTDNVFEAIGLRMFFTDGAEHPLLGTRTIEFGGEENCEQSPRAGLITESHG
jgi:protein involved in temperature-dependent protein secretion